MGNNQLKKQKKYGVDPIRENRHVSQNESMNGYARSVSPIVNSEASQFVRPQRALSTQRTMETLSKIHKIKLENRQNKVKQKYREINKCMNFSIFYVNTLEVMHINAALTSNVSVGYNFPALEKTLEKAQCGAKVEDQHGTLNRISRRKKEEMCAFERIRFTSLQSTGRLVEHVSAKKLDNFIVSSFTRDLPLKSIVNSSQIRATQSEIQSNHSSTQFREFQSQFHQQTTRQPHTLLSQHYEQQQQFHGPQQQFLNQSQQQHQQQQQYQQSQQQQSPYQLQQLSSNLKALTQTNLSHIQAWTPPSSEPLQKANVQNTNINIGSHLISQDAREQVIQPAGKREFFGSDLKHKSNPSNFESNEVISVASSSWHNQVNNPSSSLKSFSRGSHSNLPSHLDFGEPILVKQSQRGGTSNSPVVVGGTNDSDFFKSSIGSLNRSTSRGFRPLVVEQSQQFSQQKQQLHFPVGVTDQNSMQFINSRIDHSTRSLSNGGGTVIKSQKVFEEVFKQPVESTQKSRKVIQLGQKSVQSNHTGNQNKQAAVYSQKEEDGILKRKQHGLSDNRIPVINKVDDQKDSVRSLLNERQQRSYIQAQNGMEGLGSTATGTSGSVVKKLNSNAFMPNYMLIGENKELEQSISKKISQSQISASPAYRMRHESEIERRTSQDSRSQIKTNLFGHPPRSESASRDQQHFMSQINTPIINNNYEYQR